MKKNYMKIILVTGCNNCPYGAQFKLDHSEYLCSKLSAVNKNPREPLSKCTLDDAAKKIKEVKK